MTEINNNKEVIKNKIENETETETDISIIDESFFIDELENEKQNQMKAKFLESQGICITPKSYNNNNNNNNNSNNNNNNNNNNNFFYTYNNTNNNTNNNYNNNNKFIRKSENSPEFENYLYYYEQLSNEYQMKEYYIIKNKYQLKYSHQKNKNNNNNNNSHNNSNNNSHNNRHNNNTNNNNNNNNNNNYYCNKEKNSKEIKYKEKINKEIKESKLIENYHIQNENHSINEINTKITSNSESETTKFESDIIINTNASLPTDYVSLSLNQNHPIKSESNGLELKAEPSKETDNPTKTEQTPEKIKEKQPQEEKQEQTPEPINPTSQKIEESESNSIENAFFTEKNYVESAESHENSNSNEIYIQISKFETSKESKNLSSEQNSSHENEHSLELQKELQPEKIKIVNIILTITLKNISEFIIHTITYNNIKIKTKIKSENHIFNQNQNLNHSKYFKIHNRKIKCKYYENIEKWNFCRIQSTENIIINAISSKCFSCNTIAEGFLDSENCFFSFCLNCGKQLSAEIIHFEQNEISSHEYLELMEKEI